MTYYQNGNHWERKAKDELTERGWYVWQSRGSKSPADLIGIRAGSAICVQVKGGDPTPFGHAVSHREWNALYALARAAGAEAIIAERVTHTRLRWSRIVAEHAKRSREWPCVPWSLDQWPIGLPAGTTAEDE